jgi:hypothetical protein
MSLPPPSEGVTTVAAATLPFALTVKLVDATPVAPAVGPVSVTAVAADDVAVYVIVAGFVSDWLFVTEIVFAPTLDGVYVNVCAVDVPSGIVTLVGVNVPPAPPSDGVTTVAAATLPFALTVKFVDAAPTAPVVGPVSVTAVAAPDADV